MSQLTMNGLSGFMRLGPQYYPERPNAVQVIQRGPHGMFFAPDPVAERRAGKKGSGFKFWVEQEGIRPDQSWKPIQRVVGLLGLSGSGVPVSTEDKVRLFSMVNKLEEDNDSGYNAIATKRRAMELSDEVGAFENWDDSISPWEARAAYLTVVGWGTEPYDTKARLQGRLASVMINAQGRMTQAEAAADGAVLSDGSTTSQRNKANRRLQDVATELGQKLRQEHAAGKTVTAFSKEIDVVVDASKRSAADVSAAAQWVRRKGQETVESTDWLKNNWGKLALGSVAVLALYGFSQGAGSSLFRK